MAGFLRLRLEHLYPIAALAVAAFVVALMPIVPHDFWWHMAIGRDIARLGVIPQTDAYSWSLPANTPYVYQSWLSELIFYWVHQAGGLGTIVMLRNGMLTLAWAILAWNAQRRSGSWRLAGMAVVGMALLTLNNTTMRPQSFSWIPFALYWTILTAYIRREAQPRILVFLPAMMVAWVNLHGAFILGIILLGLTVTGETAKLILKRDDAPGATRVGWLWAALTATVVATIANPMGTGVFAYVFDLLTDPPSQGLVIEWQPIPITSFLGVIFALTIFLSAWLWRQVRRPVDLTDLLVWAGFLWIAISGVRYIFWWAMIAWPIIAGLLASPNPHRARVTRPALINTVLAVLIVALPLSVQPLFKAHWPLPPVFSGLGTQVQDGVLIARGTPVQAADWLKTHPLPSNARLVDDMGFGSYLIWALPHVKVYVDPRVELYPLAEWLRYKRITAACGYNRELTQIGATHLLLNKTAQQDLVNSLRRDPAWRAMYDDDQAILFARTGGIAGDAGCASIH